MYEHKLKITEDNFKNELFFPIFERPTSVYW
jgi:hypothetical protein